VLYEVADGVEGNPDARRPTEHKQQATREVPAPGLNERQRERGGEGLKPERCPQAGDERRVALVGESIDLDPSVSPPTSPPAAQYRLISAKMTAQPKAARPAACRGCAGPGMVETALDWETCVMRSLGRGRRGGRGWGPRRSPGSGRR
jgi:hypothetical protein